MTDEENEEIARCELIFWDLFPRVAFAPEELICFPT